jgi:Na+/melibiose symporter-like transporter
MSAPLSFSLRHSHGLIVAIGMLHLWPALSAYYSPTPLWFKVVVIVLLGCSGVWQLRRGLQQAGKSLLWLESGEAWVMTSAERVQVVVLSDSLDWGWLIVLHWREIGSAREGFVALTRGAFSQQAWRLLRQRLRWCRIE